jgi:hypothetical protein
MARHWLALNRRRLIQAAAAACAWPWAPHAAATEAGHALLLGNTSYNPNDEAIAPALKCISDLEVKLKRFGFNVVALHDPPIAQVKTELETLRRSVALNPGTAGVFYFVGHGFQSNAENFLVPAGGNLKSSPAELAKSCISLERDVFSRLKRPAGPAATVIMVDACRTPDKPRSPTEGYNQTLPPDGCHVAFATGPGKRAFAPNDAQRYTLFTEALVAELEASHPGSSVLSTLERVRAKVAKKVNSIEAIVKAFGPNAQLPELASNVSGDPRWTAVAVASAPGREADRPAPDTLPQSVELDSLRKLGSPEEAIAGLKRFLAKNPEGDAADLAQLRLKDLEAVLNAARIARLNLDVTQLVAGQPARLAEDVQRALQGDKYAALRVAENLPRPAANELIERTDHGRWMIFSAYLGNGIAAYRLSEHFKNVDRRDTEASRFLNLARANNYTPPRQLTQGR